MTDSAVTGAERLLGRLRRLTEIESPSRDVGGAREMAALLAQWWTDAGARVRLVESDAGPHLVAEVDGAGDPLLLVGHTDTVWPQGTLEGEVPWGVDGDVVRGPGVYDMKSGLVAMIAAVELLRGRPRRAPRSRVRRRRSFRRCRAPPSPGRDPR
jgi:glutamate carboxypeptidase